MVLRQLEYLVALAREKHFGRAAEACHVSQPTLSAAIRLLEEDLGAPIVERGHRFVGLTPQGRLVVEHAHRILAETENLRSGLEEIDKGLAGRLTDRRDSHGAADRLAADGAFLRPLSRRHRHRSLADERRRSSGGSRNSSSTPASPISTRSRSSASR